ncbi:MAG: hypothetical protein MUD01_27930, partial [Chloroflexaceae bacterium]|nr:hypothetical protein [Chloroflexaceae bacterium]
MQAQDFSSLCISFPSGKGSFFLVYYSCFQIITQNKRPGFINLLIVTKHVTRKEAFVAIELVPTQHTADLQDHEKNALRAIQHVLAAEEGFLIPGFFAFRPRQNRDQELDGVLLLPDMVVVLELKQRDAHRIEVSDKNGPMRVFRNSGFEEEEPNPLPGLDPAKFELKKLLEHADARSWVQEA